MTEHHVHEESNFQLDCTVLSGLCGIIDTARSITVGLLLQYGEYDQLVKLDINPLDYVDEHKFRDDYLLTKCGSKSPNWPTSFDREHEAKSSFWQAEEMCKDTNKRLIDASNPLPSGVREAIKIFRRILGPVKRQLGFIESQTRFGSGANVGFPAVGKVLSEKFRRSVTLTPSLIPYYRSLLGDIVLQDMPPATVVRGNKFATVPKSAKTDRGICKEPLLNSFLQLGIGACIRRRLKHNGCNLNDQTQNQKFAENALRDSLATIDLSMASDTLSKECVRLFCDSEWYHLLNIARSPTTDVDGRVVQLEKFSSMGNGYTFELETLVFLSVARGVVPKEEWHNVNAYGDDIIVPQRYAKEVILCLKFLGFKPNTEKSYLGGLFFESCGKDFFNSRPVRPFYLRGGSTKQGIPYPLQVANGLRRYAHTCGGESFCDKRFLPLWKSICKKVPKKWRYRVPPSYGDTGINTSLQEAAPRRWSKDGWCGYRIHMVYHKPIQKTHRDAAFLHKVLMGFATSDGAPKDILTDIRSGIYNPDHVGQFVKPLWGGVENYSEPRSKLFCENKEPARGLLGALVRKATFIPEWDESFNWQ